MLQNIASSFIHCCCKYTVKDKRQK